MRPSRQARTDILTGLPNRAALMSHLARIVGRSAFDGTIAALLFFDSIIAQMSLSGWEVFGTCLLVSVVGIGVGVVGSAFAVRRFLDV